MKYCTGYYTTNSTKSLSNTACFAELSIHFSPHILQHREMFVSRFELNCQSVFRFSTILKEGSDVIDCKYTQENYGGAEEKILYRIIETESVKDKVNVIY